MLYRERSKMFCQNKSLKNLLKLVISQDLPHEWYLMVQYISYMIINFIKYRYTFIVVYKRSCVQGLFSF